VKKGRNVKEVRNTKDMKEGGRKGSEGK
jgi:hypothetical protein